MHVCWVKRASGKKTMAVGVFEAGSVAEGVLRATVDLQVEETEAVTVEVEVDLDARVLSIQESMELVQGGLAVVPHEKNVVLKP